MGKILEYKLCPRCKGNGSKWYEPNFSCIPCKGSGKMIVREQVTKVVSDESGERRRSRIQGVESKPSKGKNEKSS